AIELRPVSQDAFDGTFYLYDFAEIQARVGNADEALSAIRQLLDLSAGLMMSPALLRLDPVWDRIRSDPRFEKIVASLAPKQYRDIFGKIRTRKLPNPARKLQRGNAAVALDSRSLHITMTYVS